MICAILSDVATFPAFINLSPVPLIILLVFVGELLLGLEFFVIPGFGAGGILGSIAIIAAALVAGVSYGVLAGVAVLLACAVVSFAGLLLGMRTNLIKKRFVLSTVQKKGQGTQAQNLSELSGKKGIAVSTLRPAGIAQIEGQRVDVMSEGGYIEAGAKVLVTLVEGPRVVVKEINE